MTPAPRDRKLTTNVVASRYGVQARTVREWIRRGQLRAERTPGGHFRVPESALIDCDEKNKHTK